MSPEDAASLPEDVLWRPQNVRDIAAFKPFTNMSDAKIRELLDLATKRYIDANTTLFEEDTAADRFFVLLNGVVRILRTTSDGEQVIVFHIMPGQMFGIASAFENDTYHTTARSVSEGLVLSWPSEMWDQILREYPSFLSASRGAVGSRIRNMQEKIVAMATLRVEQRIAHAIRGLIQQAGLQTNEGIEINFPITRQDLSEMTGTTLHSVSRYMSKWQKDGIVTNKRKRVIVCDPDALPI